MVSEDEIMIRSPLTLENRPDESATAPKFRTVIPCGVRDLFAGLDHQERRHVLAIVDGDYRWIPFQFIKRFPGDLVELAGSELPEHGSSVSKQFQSPAEILDTKHDGGIGRDGFYQGVSLDELDWIHDWTFFLSI